MNERSKMHKFFAAFPRPLRAVGKLIASAVVDPELLKDRVSVDSPLEHVGRSWRFRLAAAGFPLNPNEKALKALRDKYKGERCFILGNGPSLNKCDLRLLKNEITFGVNAIFLNKEKMGFSPTFLVVLDELVAEDRAEEINGYDPVEYKIFSYHLHKWLEGGEKVIWTNMRIRTSYPNPPRFSRNAIRHLFNCGTVSYMNMQLAYHMGFEKVYLVGFDHFYEKPPDLDVDGGVWTSRSKDPNHFDSSYFGKGYRWHDPKVERMELGYKVADEVFRENGRRIYNATVGGKLEVFERVPYDSLFGGAGVA